MGLVPILFGMCQGDFYFLQHNCGISRFCGTSLFTKTHDGVNAYGTVFLNYGTGRQSPKSRSKSRSKSESEVDSEVDFEVDFEVKVEGGR